MYKNRVSMFQKGGKLIAFIMYKKWKHVEVVGRDIMVCSSVRVTPTTQNYLCE